MLDVEVHHSLNRKKLILLTYLVQILPDYTIELPWLCQAGVISLKGNLDFVSAMLTQLRRFRLHWPKLRMILGGMKSVGTISVDGNYTGTNPVDMTLTKNLPTGILPTGIVPTDFMPPGIIPVEFQQNVMSKHLFNMSSFLFNISWFRAGIFTKF